MRQQLSGSPLTLFTASPRPLPRRRRREPPRAKRELPPTVLLVPRRQVPTRRRLVVLESPRPRLPKSSMLRCRTTSVAMRQTAPLPLLPARLLRLPRPLTTMPTWTRSPRWSTRMGVDEHRSAVAQNMRAAERNTTVTGRLDRLFYFILFGLACKNTTADCDELGAEATALAGLGSRSCCCARKRESCDERHNQLKHYTHVSCFHPCSTVAKGIPGH